MKGSHILLICVGILVLVACCCSFLSLPSVIVYESKYDSFSIDQIDPSTKKLITDNNAEKILPLMDEMDYSFGQIAIAIRCYDLDYLKEMLDRFDSQHATMRNILNAQKLPKSELNIYYQSASRVKPSGTNLNDCLNRSIVLLQNLEFSGNEHFDISLGNLNNLVLLNTDQNRENLQELSKLGVEMMNDIVDLQKAAKKMDEVARMFGLSTTDLDLVEYLLNDYISLFTPLVDGKIDESSWQNIGQVIIKINTEYDQASSWEERVRMVYEENDESSPPLPDTQVNAETKEQSILYYCCILLVLLVGGGFLVWRFVHKRKVVNPGDVAESIEPSESVTYVVESANQHEDKDDEDAFEEIGPEILRPVAEYPQGLDAIEDIRGVYRCVIYAVAEICGIEHVDALTPFEAARASGIPQLMPFIERYVYLRYGALSVSADDLRELKMLAKNLAEILQRYDS